MLGKIMQSDLFGDHGMNSMVVDAGEKRGLVTVDRTDDRLMGFQSRIFNDVMKKSKSGWYPVISAMHKEIRRGDWERGNAYAWLIAKTFGPYRVSQYLRGIVFEETRNVSLFNHLLVSPKAKTVREAVELMNWFTRSQKKWQIEQRWEIYDAGYNLEVLNSIPMYHDHAAIEDDARSAIGSGSSADLWRVMWGVILVKVLEDPCRKGVDKVFADCLLSGMSKLGMDDDVPLFEGYMKHSWFHGCQFALERLCGLEIEPLMGDSMPELEMNVSDDHVVPALENYVFDRHTSLGLMKTKKHLREIVKNTHHPDVDLRWSGVTMGCLWRELAGRLPDYSGNTGWFDVPMPRDRWDAAVQVDVMTEARLFGEYTR